MNTNKINLIGVINILPYQILAISLNEEIQKCHMRTIYLKYQLLRGMMNLNYIMDNNWFEIFKIILSSPSKN